MDGDREGVGRGWMVTGRGWGGDRMDSDREGVTVLAVTLARKVSPGLQDLQTRTRRILAERNAKKAEENTWIGWMVATESIGELNGLIKSRAA